MKDFKDISRIFSIARANDMQIEFNKKIGGGFCISPYIEGSPVLMNDSHILDKDNCGQVTVGEFKNLVEFLNLDENAPIKLTFYNRRGTISEEGELQSVSIDKDGCLCLSSIR